MQIANHTHISICIIMLQKIIMEKLFWTAVIHITYIIIDF